MSHDPLFTIVTPSYNQVQFIEETIQSVQSQSAPGPVEHWIVDGGSSDGTLEVVGRYRSRVQWLSEKDEGQAHALNKGMMLARGEIIGWINSDDYYLEDVFSRVADAFQRDANLQWAYGDFVVRNEVTDRTVTRKPGPFDLGRLLVSPYIAQPSVFFRRAVLAKVGLFDASLRHAFDYDYWLRLGLRYPAAYIPAPLSCFRIHGESKTTLELGAQRREGYDVQRRYARNLRDLGVATAAHYWVSFKTAARKVAGR